MKEIAFFGFLQILTCLTAIAQSGGFHIDFENPIVVDYYVSMDTISNPNNIWQVGTPGKEVLSDPYSPKNVIITDTINSYPVNDTSTFIIRHLADAGFVEPHSASLGGYYKVDTDSIKDYGLIEFSPDNGYTWIDIINDPLTAPYWYSEKPILSGKSDWTLFYVELAPIGYPREYGDTVLFRFTFISDSIDNHRGGLMFDDIWIEDFIEGILHNSTNSFSSKVFPNPSDHNITISFSNTLFSNVYLDIMDGLGRLIFRSDSFRTSSISVDISDFAPGIYYYKLLNENEKKGSWGKFLVE